MNKLYYKIRLLNKDCDLSKSNFLEKKPQNRTRFVPESYPYGEFSCFKKQKIYFFKPNTYEHLFSENDKKNSPEAPNC
jgi:hypothetical protein